MSCAKRFAFVAERLAVGYDGKALVRDIDFSVNAGECILLCGANGTGKSTLLRTLAGLQRPLSGRCGFTEGGKAVLVPARIPKVGGFTVEEFIATACSRDTDWLGRMPARMKGRARAAMRAVGIDTLSGRDISTLSDGEFQKASVCTALVRNADLILLDEPTSFLDVDNKESVMHILREITTAGEISVIFSSHDINVAGRHCTRTFGIAGESFIDAPASDMDVVFSRCFASRSDRSLTDDV